MSIILKALRKVQHQNNEQPSRPSSTASGKDAAAPQGPSMGSHSTSSSGGSIPAVSRDRTHAQEDSGAIKPPHEAAERHLFGSVPKLLIAVVVTVGMFATGWFLNRIYSNFPSVTETREAKSRVDAGQALPEADAPRGIPPRDQEVVSAALRPAVTDTPAVESATVPVPAPSPQVARTSVTESPPQPPAPAAVPGPSGLEAADHVEKEVKPKEPGRPKLKINAIAWRMVEPKAIVNMRVVFVGDVIEGATVVAIRRTSVIFEFEGETFEVRFGSAGSD